MTALFDRSRCDECGNAPAVVQIDDVFFLCASCEAIVCNTVTSAPSGSGVNAAATKALAPCPLVAAATNSELVGPLSAFPASGSGCPTRSLGTRGKKDQASIPSSCGGSDARNGGLLSKQLSMASRLRPPGPQDSISPATATRRVDDLGSVQDARKMSTDGQHCAEATSASIQRDIAQESVTAGETATNSNPVSSPIPPAPANCGAVSLVEAAPLFSSADPGMAGFDIEAAVASLESEWIRAGISLADCAVKNSTTFRVVASNDSISKSISVGA